jgi:hypothetical protein
VTAALPALASVVLAAVIVVAGYAVSAPLLALGVGLAVLVLAVGWGRLLELPAARGTAVAILLTGWAGAGVAVLAAKASTPLAPFTVLLAGAVLIAFGHELIRRHGRPHLVESVTGTFSGQTLALLGGGWVLLPVTSLGVAAMATAAAAAAAARVAELLPVPERIAGWLAAVIGVAVGAFTGIMVDPKRPLPLLMVALVVAAVVAGLDRLLLLLPRARTGQAALAGAAAPVLAVGTVAYAVARMVA